MPSFSASSLVEIWSKFACLAFFNKYKQGFAPILVSQSFVSGAYPGLAMQPFLATFEQSSIFLGPSSVDSQGCVLQNYISDGAPCRVFVIGVLLAVPSPDDDLQV